MAKQMVKPVEVNAKISVDRGTGAQIATTIPADLHNDLKYHLVMQGRRGATSTITEYLAELISNDRRNWHTPPEVDFQG